MKPPSIKTRNGGYLILSDWKNVWTWKGNVESVDLATAREMTDKYKYSPADGYPGYLLTQNVAKMIGGEVILPDFPDLPEGAVP